MINGAPCKNWTGPSFTSHGNTYGRLPGKKTLLVHRVAYEEQHGPIPSDLVIDHLCRNGLCYEVRHLEAVPNAVNVMRGNGPPAMNARKTHCKRGHELTPNNIFRRVNRRACKQCNHEREKAKWAARKTGG